jgi:hypothetical protein
MIYDPFLPLVVRICLWFLAALVIMIGWMVLNSLLIALLWGKDALPPSDYWATQFWLVFLAGCARPEAFEAKR